MKSTHAAAAGKIAEELEIRLQVHREAARDHAALAFGMLADAVVEALASLRALAVLPAEEVAAAVEADRMDMLRGAPEVDPRDGWPAFPDAVADSFWAVADA